MKSSDHDPINEMYFNELEELKNGIQMYRASDNKLVRVHAILVADIMDRPERSTMTGILGHGGKWSKRWKYSLELNLSKGVSCQRCWNNRLRQIKDFYEGKTKEFNMECSRCANFNYLHPQLHVLPH